MTNLPKTGPSPLTSCTCFFTWTALDSTSHCTCFQHCSRWIVLNNSADAQPRLCTPGRPRSIILEFSGSFPPTLTMARAHFSNPVRKFAVCFSNSPHYLLGSLLPRWLESRRLVTLQLESGNCQRQRWPIVTSSGIKIWRSLDGTRPYAHFSLQFKRAAKSSARSLIDEHGEGNLQRV